ncbi:MAG: hypothetical protein GY940_38905 [bacterium]|nr:hypothetical protein [bacterium]
MFPNYNNSSGAGGNFELDTTPINDGVHSIQWVVTDDRGQTRGIGLRYFTIRNRPEGEPVPVEEVSGRVVKNLRVPFDYYRPVRILKGYDTSGAVLRQHPDSEGNISVNIRELEPIRIFLGDGPEESERSSAVYTGYIRVGNE